MDLLIKDRQQVHDKNEVRNRCSGRWIELITRMGGIPSEILDGNHHPCPKCGGNDRFRLVDESAGACFCNACFNSQNGDGFGAIAWLSGKSFEDVVNEVGQLVGAPEKETKKRGRKKGPPPLKVENKFDEMKAKMWCIKQPGITPDGLRLAGVKFGTHFYEGRPIPVLAMQHHNGKTSKGWSVIALSGAPLQTKGGPTKIKVAAKSENGMIGEFAKIESANLVIKLEGPKDVLALLSLPGRPEGIAVVTNSNGAIENPTKQTAFLDAIKDKDVIVIHDCDKAGQEGATQMSGKNNRPGRPGWVPVCSRFARSVKNVVLPYEPDSGKDLRDWIIDGGTWPKLLELFEKFEVEKEDEIAILRKINDPDFLAELNLKYYQDSQEGRLMHWRDTWWKYKAGKWRHISNSELEKKVTQRVRTVFEEDYRRRMMDNDEDDSECKQTSSRLINNVIKSIASMVSPLPDHIDQPCLISTRERLHWLTVENGILNLGELTKDNIEEINLDNFKLKHTPDWFSQVKLEYEYDENADCPIWKSYLNKVMEGDHQMVELLQQWCGYLLTTRNDLQKFMIFEGPGGNGKSVFFAGITAMLGTRNISNLPLESFSKQFDLGVTVGKMVNICGDISELDNVGEGKIKEFTGGGQMVFDRKNKDPITAVPTAKLMGAWNLRPHIRDRSDAIWRRMILVPFSYKVKPEERVYGMDTSQFWHDKREVSGILNWAIEGLLELQAAGWSFIRPEKVVAAGQHYQEDSSPTRQFISDQLEYGDDAFANSFVSLADLYEGFRLFCKEIGNPKPLGRNKFKLEFEQVTSLRFDRKRDESERKRGFFNVKFKEGSVMHKQRSDWIT